MCYRFVRLAELCMMLYPADPRFEENIIEATGLMEHEQTLSFHLPRCFGRFLKPWQDAIGNWSYDALWRIITGGMKG